MRVALEQLDRHRVRLEVEVDKAEVSRAWEESYRKFAGRVHIPGFRRGRAPMGLVERYVGAHALRKEALEILLDRNYPRALAHAQVEPIGRPELEIVRHERDEPLVFKVTVEVKPGVKLGAYRGVEVDVPRPPVTEEEVQAELQALRERLAELVPADTDTVSGGQVAVIDYRGTVGGEPFEGGAAKGQTVEVGGGGLLDDFERGLLGARVNETRTVTVRFPESYANPDLAAKEAEFEVTVREIKARRLPDLDDELARRLGAGETVGELISTVRQGLEALRHQEARQALRDAVVRQVVDAAQVDLPPSMVDRRLDRVVQDFTEQLARRGLTLEQYLQQAGIDQDRLRADLRPRAEREVKEELVLEAVARVEGISVTEQEVETRIQQTAGAYGRGGDRIRTLFRDPANREGLAHAIRLEKAASFLADHARNRAAAQAEAAATEPEP